MNTRSIHLHAGWMALCASAFLTYDTTAFVTSNNALSSLNAPAGRPPGAPANSSTNVKALTAKKHRQGEIVIKLRENAETHTALKNLPEQVKHGNRLGSAKFQQLLEKHRVKRIESAFRTQKDRSAKSNTKARGQAKKQAERPDLFRWFRLRLPDDSDVEAVAAEFQKNAEVEFAEPNYDRRLDDNIPYPISGIPDQTTDPNYDEQWHHTAALTPAAWDHLRLNGVHPGGSHDVIIAVIDTGVDATHPDLAGNIWTNGGEIPNNGIDDDNNGFVDDIHGCSVVSDSRSHSGDSSDYHGHGTHVAGIAASQGYNHVGGVGVAFNVQIMAIRAADYSGTLTAVDIAEAVLYAVDHGAEVINMSFGGYQRSQIEEDALAVALSQALLIAAAGNDGINGFDHPHYPSALPFVHGVMASTPTGKRAWFSNYGYDVAAPGVSIFSTLPGNTYASWSGTSMATPIVSGVAALLRSFYWQRDIYSSRYLMGAVWAASSPIINAHLAVTTLPAPGVSIVQTWLFDSTNLSSLNDGDGQVDSGETVHLAVEVINRAGFATNVVANLRARAPSAVQDDPYVTILTTNASFGDIGPWNTADNGFIYNEQGVLTGVSDPVVFRIDPNCPNDHVIQFELEIQFNDAWDPAGPRITRVSRFRYVVQRGKNVPSVISTNTVLTADQYWIVPGPVLVEAGAKLTIEAGAQVQWGAVSSDPYNPGPQSGYIIVRGALSVEGSVTNPANLFPSYLVSGQTTAISVDPSGVADISYARVVNPNLSGFRGIDHAIFQWDVFASQVKAQRISNSRFHKFRGGGTIQAEAGFDTCLFDAGWIMPSSGSSAPAEFLNCVFLQDNENNRQFQFTVPTSFPDVMAKTCLWWGDCNYFYAPFTTNGETWVALWMPGAGGWRIAEPVANYFGGHIAAINGQSDWDILQSWLPTVPQYNRTMFHVAMLNTRQPGQFRWLDGTPVTFTSWDGGQPGAPFIKDTLQTIVGYKEGASSLHLGWANNVERGPWEAEFHLLRLPGTWSLAQLQAPMNNGQMIEYLKNHYIGYWRFNAFLNKYWDPDVTRWMRFYTSGSSDNFSDMRENWWGTESPTLIDHAVVDFYDNFLTPKLVYNTPPTNGYSTTYPFLQTVLIDGLQAHTVPILEGGRTSFTVVFNRDMNTNVEPFVSFGPSPPHTDFAVYPRDANFQVVSNGWINARMWRGDVWITPVTGNGYHGIRVSDAVAADDPWLVTGYDVARFRFRVQTTGVASMSLQANGGEGFIDLSWQQNDYDLVAGYNVYRAASLEGPYDRLNATLVPVGQESYRDTNVPPAIEMFYRFSVVTTDFVESESSEPAAAAAFDTIAPSMVHVPLPSASPGQNFRISAVCSDNVAVSSVTLRYRLIGTSSYNVLSMLNTAGSNWSATVPGSAVQPAGLEYYIVASDGLNNIFSGTAAAPHTTIVSDTPSVLSVSPSQGSALGGMSVTINGTQFLPGASVLFGGVLANNISVISANQISCLTPPHFPAGVEVKVINTNGSFASRLNAYLYTSSNAVVSLPAVTGDYGTITDVLVSASDLVGMRAAELTIQFDSAVLSVASVSAGAMTAGWAITANTSTPGRIVVSLASATAVSGSGPIVRLGFNVIAPPPSNTFLRLTNVALNDGSLLAQVQDGSFVVNGFWSLRGTVRHVSGQSVSDTRLSLVGIGSQQATSATDGGFTFTNLPTGSYVLTPAKASETNGITAYDASLVLQAAVGSITLTPEQVLAADVNRNGLVTAMDASYILERSIGLIGLPFPNAGKIWEFIPATRAYQPLSDDLTGQDFTGILIGDVSGNWAPDGGAGMEAPKFSRKDLSSPSLPVIALDSMMIRRTQEVHRLLFASATEQVFSIEVTLHYDSSTAIASIVPGVAASGFAFAANTNEPGLIRLALAGATPLLATGEIARLTFDSSTLEPLLEAVAANEGIPVVRINANAGEFDRDADGLVDFDETQLFGTNPDAADSDGDQMNDGAEILAGSDPSNPDSVLRIITVTHPSVDQIKIVWFSVMGERYQIEAASTLGGPWTVLPEIYSAETDTTAGVFTMAEGQRVYRIRLAE